MNFAQIEIIKAGRSVNKPPIMDGKKHEYWNVMMVTFLIALGIKEWKAMIIGWKYPIITSFDGITSLKPEADWTKVEYDKALSNSKALNVFLKGVAKEMLKLIDTCLESK